MVKKFHQIKNIVEHLRLVIPQAMNEGLGNSNQRFIAVENSPDLLAL